MKGQMTQANEQILGRYDGTLNNAELPRNIRGLCRPTIKCGICNAELMLPRYNVVVSRKIMFNVYT